MSIDKQSLLSMMKLDDICSPLNSYAAVIGIENLFNLCEIAGGKRIYLPKADALLKDLRKRLVIMDYKSGGYTLESLARKYEMSITTVHNCVHR